MEVGFTMQTHPATFFPEHKSPLNFEKATSDKNPPQIRKKKPSQPKIQQAPWEGGDTLTNNQTCHVTYNLQRGNDQEIIRN